MLSIGTKAPEFALPNQEGQEIRLADFRGQKVLLYFYPRDNTPGCSRQAQAFAQVFSSLKAQGVAVLGISKDTVSSHRRFADIYHLPFSILSDPELLAIRAYEVWQEKKLYGKVSMGVVRTSYLIDEQGVIEQIWEKAKPDTNAAEVLQYVTGEG